MSKKELNSEIIGEVIFGGIPFCLKCYTEFHNNEEPDEHIRKNDKGWKRNPKCTMCGEVICVVD